MKIRKKVRKKLIFTKHDETQTYINPLKCGLQDLRPYYVRPNFENKGIFNFFQCKTNERDCGTLSGTEWAPQTSIKMPVITGTAYVHAPSSQSLETLGKLLNLFKPQFAHL